MRTLSFFFVACRARPQNEIYMCGYLTCPLRDDSSGYMMMRMCASSAKL